jgi:hypothetical protein
VKKKVFGSIIVCCVVVSAGFASSLLDGKIPKKKSRRIAPPVKIIGIPVGPSREALKNSLARIQSSGGFQKDLAGVKYRILSSQYIDNGTSKPTRFQATIYDYTNDRTFTATGDLAGMEDVVLKEEAFQPRTSDEEFAEAVSIVQGDAGLGTSLDNGSLNPFEPMPPITVINGTTGRLVNVGLGARNSSAKNEIVGVSLKRGVVVHYNGGAPPSALAAADACGPPANIPSTPNPGPGSAQITVLQSNSPLWEMLVQTPLGSSGTNGSGIELQNVKYKGKLVFKRASVPILDVQYTDNVCGPFRDWTNQQSAFQAPLAGATYPNVDINGGFIILADGQVATTILETGDDGGDFRGVAIYRQNNETVMVSEMGAGWYRYIMEWRFADDGTIRPRFGFGAVSDSCVCNIHFHHVYWRFDFDIVNSANKVFQVERGRRFRQPITTEIVRTRNVGTNRSILVQNANGDEGYLVVPNLSDGNADVFGVSDFWVLKYKPPTGDPVTSEIDDGKVMGPSADPSINISPWVNSEALVNQDVVVWYGAHFTHDDADGALLNVDRSGQVISGSHVVGPDLRPIRW